NIPANIFSNGQAPPTPGKNSIWESIRAKQAWGDVKTPLGRLTFGRMPDQWGLGMWRNSGGYDPVHDTYCLDCDFGDAVDRIMFAAMIPGTNFRAAIGFDWSSSGPSSLQTDIFANRLLGQPWDLDDADDITEWAIQLARIDDADEWKNLV